MTQIWGQVVAAVTPLYKLHYDFGPDWIHKMYKRRHDASDLACRNKADFMRRSVLSYCRVQFRMSIGLGGAHFRDGLFPRPFCNVDVGLCTSLYKHRLQ